MNDADRAYHRRYMREYRAQLRRQKSGDATPRPRRRIRPRVFKCYRSRRGYCCFCGLRTNDVLCSFCRGELETGRVITREVL